VHLRASRETKGRRLASLVEPGDVAPAPPERNVSDYGTRTRYSSGAPHAPKLGTRLASDFASTIEMWVKLRKEKAPD
jgi:hypothetical protein